MMSVVALADGTRSSVTIDTLRDVAIKNHITIPTASDESAYLLLLQSVDATIASIDKLPDFIRPELKPQPVAGGERKYWKPKQNPLNGWSHMTELSSTAPSSEYLKGRTVAIKDNMSVGGVPLTIGTFPELASQNGKYAISPMDATVVTRILQAGAIIKGTSTCENYSLTPFSYTSATGPVHNPWQCGYTCGGSSSGSACLVSLGTVRERHQFNSKTDPGEGVELAMGGDQGGSIRLPASYTGIYGLKPTFGLIPYTGIASLHPMIDHCGPMARNLKDIATFLTVLAGYDGLDPRMTPESPLLKDVKDYWGEVSNFIGEGGQLQKKLGKGIKIGILKEGFEVIGMSSEVREVVQTAAFKHFTAAGATVEEVSIPMHSLGPAIWTASTRSAVAELAVKSSPPSILTHTMPHLEPRWPPDQQMYDLLTKTNPAVVNVLFSGTFLNEKYGPAVVAKAHRHVLELRAAYDSVLEHYDVLVMPTAPTVAMKHPNLQPEHEGGSSVMDKISISEGATNNTCPFNATGHPAISIPCGWGKGEVENEEKAPRLPVGMQIVGNRWDELGVLKAVAVFEAGGGGLPA